MDYDYTPSEIGLKIASTTSMATCVSIIRKYNPVSMAEIKDIIDSNKYVLTSSVIDDSGMKKIKKCYDELIRSGATVEIYERDEIITPELVSNIINTNLQINLEVQAQIDAEVAAEEADSE